METTPLLALYCVLILCASVAGGLVPTFVRLTHKRMELAVSFVAGLMLGVGILHLLPHALVEMGPAGKLDFVMWSLLGGFLAMFFVERFFCYHHHDAPDDPDSLDHATDGQLPIVTTHAAGEHVHEHGPGCNHGHGGEHAMTWSGAAIGMTLHSILDGVALAASVAADAHGHRELTFAGLGTFLVVFCHKPFDSLTLGTLLARGGKPSLFQHIVNGAFSLAVVAGVLLFQAGLAGTPGDHGAFLPCALAFAAGTFLCIAMSDLLPELQFHHHDRAKLSLALMSGLAIAWAIGLFETRGHSFGEHQHAPPAAVQGSSSR